MSLTDEQRSSLEEYPFPTEVDFGGDRVHVQNINIINRDMIENVGALDTSGQVSLGYAFTECDGTAVTSTVTFSKWEQNEESGSLWIGT